MKWRAIINQAVLEQGLAIFQWLNSPQFHILKGLGWVILEEKQRKESFPIVWQYKRKIENSVKWDRFEDMMAGSWGDFAFMSFILILSEIGHLLRIRRKQIADVNWIESVLNCYSIEWESKPTKVSLEFLWSTKFLLKWVTIDFKWYKSLDLWFFWCVFIFYLGSTTLSKMCTGEVESKSSRTGVSQIRTCTWNCWKSFGPLHF